MKVAIFDIDDTITYETEFLLKKATYFLIQNNLSDQIINPNGYNLGEIYGIRGKLEECGISSEEAVLQEKKLTDCFWNRYFLNYNMQQFRPNVKRIVDL